MPRLFALDKNFPQPIVSVLSDFQADARLVPLDRIDPRMSTLDDWELLLALHHHAEPWDGLITTDSSMLAQGRELATLIQNEAHPRRCSGLRPQSRQGIRPSLRLPCRHLPAHKPRTGSGMATQRRQPRPRRSLGVPQAFRDAQRPLDRQRLGTVQTIGRRSGARPATPRRIVLAPRGPVAVRSPWRWRPVRS